MDIEKAKQLSYEKIRNLYKTFLLGQGLESNTVQTFTGDSFYLWNNVGKEEFWNIVSSVEFETIARDALFKALSANSKGNVPALVNGYLANLRRFRNYIYSEEDISYEELDDAKALREFLLDIECLDPLTEWTNKFNMFDILRITRTEIRHSNILAWILNPNENHGMGDSVIRGFIQHITTMFPDDMDVFDTLLMDYHTFTIQREWHNIDILAVSLNEKFVLCIENKIDSVEHDDQLNRYREIIENTYPDYSKIYIFLSPGGIEASDTEYWCSMSYEEVLKIVENAKKKVQLLPDVELLINNYVEAVRRDIVGDERLVQICTEIYAKHKKALDLIFENRPDRAMEIANVFKAWAIKKAEDGEIKVALDKCGKTYIYFTTKKMSNILPNHEEALSGWNTKSPYYYLIRNLDGNGFLMYLTINSKNLTEEQREICSRISAHCTSKPKKENWQWWTPFTAKQVKIDEEMTEEKIFELLDKNWEELKKLEEKIGDMIH